MTRPADGPPAPVLPAAGRTGVWQHALLATFALALGVALVTVVATGAIPARTTVDVAPAPGFGGWEAPRTDVAGLDALPDALVRYDALWYLAIARDGYPTTEEVPPAAAFFPGYPLLAGALATLLGGRTVLAATLLSALSTVAALVALHALADRVLGADGSGRRAVLVTALFPTSFFLLAPYAEALFLAASLWALLLAASRRPVAAGTLALVATVTRPVGALLAIPLLLGVHRGSGVRTVDRLAGVVGVGAGGLLVLAHGWVRWGDPLAVLTAQDGWLRTWSWPWVSLTNAVRFGLRDVGSDVTVWHTLDLLVVAVAVAAVLALVRRGEWPLVLHAVVTVGLWLAQPFPGRPLLSAPRFALVVPAVLLGLTSWTARETRLRSWLVVGAVLWTLHLALFSRWWFVF